MYFAIHLIKSNGQLSVLLLPPTWFPPQNTSIELFYLMYFTIHLIKLWSIECFVTTPHTVFYIQFLKRYQNFHYCFAPTSV